MALACPQYSFHAAVSATPDGKSSVTGELTRTGVPDNWKDVIPIYAHIGDKVLRMGSIAAMHSTEPISFAVAGKIDKITINEYEDLLGNVKQ